MYESFYGGRRGASFVIVKSYGSVNEMIEVFSQGGAYTTVGYDEYVLIDTIDKNDKENGRIYRRGYEYNNEMGGAVYIGQIVGPTGPAPHVEMKTIDEVEAIYDEFGPVDRETGDTYRRTAGEYAPLVNLTPGQYYDEEGNEQFNDTIQWVMCSVRDAHSHESTVHIGFKIPFLVQQYTAETVSPYYHRSDVEHTDWNDWSETGDTTNFENEELIKRTDDLAHPFFEKWHISIPKGIKGDKFKSLRVTTVGECEEKNPGWLQAYVGKEDDEETIAKIKERKILVYDYYHYDRDAGGDPVSIFLGDYNMIDDVNVDQYGTLTIDYSHDDEEIYKNIFKWIKDIRLNVETGFFEIEYNYDKTRDGIDKAKEDTKYEMYLTWVKDMDVKEDGTISWTFTTSEDDKEYPNFIKWVKEVKLNAETGLFEMDFNYETDPNTGNPTHFEQSLTWVKDIAFAQDGTVTLTYTDQADTVYDNLIKWIKSVTLDENGHLVILYNYDEEGDGTPTKYETDLRWLDNIRIDEDGTIHFDYTYGDEQTFEKYLKVIKKVTLDSVTGKLEVTYNQEQDKDGNPTYYTTDLRWVNYIEIADNGNVTLKYTTGEDVLTDAHLKWIKETTLDSDGTLTINYNDSTKDVFDKKIQWITSIEFTDSGHLTINYNNGTDPIEKDILWPTNFEIQTGANEGEGDQKLKISWNNGDETVVGNAINYVMNTAIDDRYHMLILFSDPERRRVIKEQSLNATWEGRDDWFDAGYIGNGTGSGAIAGKESDTGITGVAKEMPPYSVWLVVEEEK